MTGLSTEFERVSLPLERPFTIARGTQTDVENVLVRIDDGDHTGVGAAAPARYYGETPATVEAVLPDLLAVVEDVGDPLALDRIERRTRETVRDNPAAHAAVSIALHDLAARRFDVPLYRLWGLDPERTPPTSFTVGLDSLEAMREKTEAAVEAGYPVLKLKLGTDRDERLIEAVREAAPAATIRVDANEGWTPRRAIRMCETLADYDVEFVEQPVPATNAEGLRRVYDASPLPVAADESCVTLEDVPRIADRADIANVKLMKCGGLREAERMIHAARAHGIEVMLGCMVESAAAIAAACHLAPLADYADLDGALLLAGDACDGPDLSGGEIRLDSAVAGTGARVAE